jgi:hypothetical protein
MAHFSDRFVSANKLIIAAAVVYAGAVTLAHADQASFERHSREIDAIVAQQQRDSQFVLGPEAYAHCMQVECSREYLEAHRYTAADAQAAGERDQAERVAQAKLDGLVCPVGKYACATRRNPSGRRGDGAIAL